MLLKTNVSERTKNAEQCNESRGCLGSGRAAVAGVRSTIHGSLRSQPQARSVLQMDGDSYKSPLARCYPRSG